MNRQNADVIQEKHRSDVLAPKRIRRKFSISSTVSSLVTFVESTGLCPRNYKVCTGFPKRDILRDCNELTLLDWGINANCVVDVEIV